MLEALFECLADDKTLYDKFCDRLDADLIPFVTGVNGGVNKLEFPLPPTHVFSVKIDKEKRTNGLRESNKLRVNANERSMSEYSY